MKVLQPTTSYEIAFPDDIVEDHDGKVASYWRPGSSVLLQLSSTARVEGEQAPADVRLQDLFMRNRSHGFPLR